MVEGTLVRSLDHFQGLLRTPSSMGSQAQPRTCYQFCLVLYIQFDTLAEGDTLIYIKLAYEHLLSEGCRSFGAFLLLFLRHRRHICLFFGAQPQHIL